MELYKPDMMELYNPDMMGKYGGMAMEKQLFFADVVGKMDWNVDMAKGEIAFGGNYVFPMQILGSFSHSSETWLWGWANSQSNLPEKLLIQANKLREYGDINKIDWLVNGQFEINRNWMHYIGHIALGMFEASGYYLGNFGAGTICLTISAKDIDQKFPNNPLSIFTVFPQLISRYEVNHKESFVNYLIQKKYEIEKNGNEILGKNGEYKVKASFDNMGRMTELKNIE